MFNKDYLLKMRDAKEGNEWLVPRMERLIFHCISFPNFGVFFKQVYMLSGQGGLACCDSWGHKESDTTERLI